MKASLVILAAAAALAASIFASSSPGSAATSACPDVVKQYGHVKSLIRKGNRFELRFDPALWLTGVPAERAKLEDTGSTDVPNDYYIVDEGHRLLTYVVPASARVTILTGGGATSTRITVAELAQIVAGRNPKHRRLSEQKAGYWIRIGNQYPSPVLSLDQQYQP
jgi:hypothetical protein